MRTQANDGLTESGVLDVGTPDYLEAVVAHEFEPVT